MRSAGASAVCADAIDAALDQFGDARQLAFRDTFTDRREQALDEIAHGVRALCFVLCCDRLRVRARGFAAREHRLQHGHDEARQHGHGQHDRDRDAAAMPLHELARAVPARWRMGMHGQGFEVALEVIGEFARTGIASLGLLGQRAQQDIVEVAAQRRAQHGARCRQAPLVGGIGADARRRTCRMRAVGPFAEQQFVQHDAERIHIGRGRDRAAGELLRCGVGRRQWRVARSRHRDAIARLRVEQLRNAEVEQLHRAVGAYEDVRRLEVAMHDQQAVRGCHRTAGDDHQAQARAQVELCRARVLVIGRPSTYSMTSRARLRR